MPKLVEAVAYFLTEYDGFVAFPTVRGEGHLHDLGRYMNKQNAFSDFQAAARRLIELKYTEPKLIAIHGTSHGGLLVTVCVNQAPGIYNIVATIYSFFLNQNLLFTRTLWRCYFQGRRYGYAPIS